MTTYTLRDYQHDIIQQVFTTWISHRRVLMQLPTGAGKTIVFSALAREIQEPVLVVAHRRELIFQAAEKLEALTGQKCGIIKRGHRPTPDARIQVASVQTLARRSPSRWPKASLLVVDEAHHSCANSYQKLFKHYQEAYCLGVTATPSRADGQGFNYLYDAMIVGPPVKQLMDSGYLCPYKLYAAPEAVNIAGVKVRGGDYDQRQLEEAVNTSVAFGDLIKSWRQFANGLKTVVFTVSVAHSKAIAAAYVEAGIPAEHLDGETPEELRREILSRYSRSETLVLTNCGIVSEGFDLPSIAAIQIVRPTKSFSLWFQMLGRVLRPSPGKTHAIVIDHTHNWVVHPGPEEPTNWSLEPESLPIKQRWVAVCPKCEHAFRPLPHEKLPVKREWNGNKGEFLLTYQYTCPNCRHFWDIFNYECDGESPSPRGLEKRENVELYEIPPGTDMQFLRNLYTALKQKKKVSSESIFNRVTLGRKLSLLDIEVAAQLLNQDSDFISHQWSLVLAAKIKNADCWSAISDLMAANQPYRVRTWALLSPTDRQLVHQLKCQDIWPTVLSEIQPLPKQVLATQHCRLLYIDARIAKIGVSKPLIKLVISSVPNIESAFEKVLGHPIKLAFQVSVSF